MNPVGRSGIGPDFRKVKKQFFVKKKALTKLPGSVMIAKVDRDCEEEGGVMKIEEIIENNIDEVDNEETDNA